MGARASRDDGGTAAVEFALISIPFILLVFGMIQYGWFFYVAQTTGGAASNVVRRLQVGDCWSGNQALTLAQNQAPMVSSVDKNPSAMPTTRGTDITITLTADGSILGLIPMPHNGQITKTVHARLEDTDTSGSCS
ncbi:Flp pilus assembly protein TadG [Marmoricola sp. URHA0025 HA25]